MHKENTHTVVEGWVVSDGEGGCIAISMATMTKASIKETKRKENAGFWEEMWCGHCVSVIRLTLKSL